MSPARRAPEGAADRLRAFRHAKVLGKCFVDFATMFREMWGCGLCVCLFSGPVGPKGGPKQHRKDDFMHIF